jgi:hypothetical protein
VWALRGVQGLAGGDREAAVGVREMRNGAPVEFFFITTRITVKDLN